MNNFYIKNKLKSAGKSPCLHFVGIGGAGMSGLAFWALDSGYAVSGSDIVENHNTALLQKLGARIYYSHQEENAYKADIVIFTSAVGMHNPEVLYAAANNKCVMERHKFLGLVFNGFSKSIAISGSHGKTTCTTMAAHILKGLGVSTLCFAGGNSSVLGNRNYSAGKQLCLAEACEYRKNFLSLKPKVGVILNIESDHNDFFKSKNQLTDAFKEFAANIQKNGSLIICGDESACREIYDNNNQLRQNNIDIITYGFNSKNTVRAKNLHLKKGRYSFDIVQDDRHFPAQLSIPGKHNVLNALAAFSAVFAAVTEAKSSNILKTTSKFEDINCKNKAAAEIETCHSTQDTPKLRAARLLQTYPGVSRRFERLGTFCGAEVISDYAHHPREIVATLKSARQIYKKSVITAVFQPHTYSRTKALMGEFAACFAYANRVILLPVYSAREEFDPSGSSQTLLENIETCHSNVLFVHSFTDVKEILRKEMPQNKQSVIVVIGAGDINLLAQSLVKQD